MILRQTKTQIPIIQKTDELLLEELHNISDKFALDLENRMFKNTFQSGFLSILYSIGSKPLQIWDKKVRNGHIKRITDQDIQVQNQL